MLKAMIGGMHLLMGWSRMLLVAERLTDGEIISISILYFDFSFKYTFTSFEL
jgi:hypothetical protein